MVAFTATRREMATIGQIADRALGIWAERGAVTLDPASLMMDLDAVHSNGCPLDFAKLLAFGTTDFIHDIAGIRARIDRSTGKLTNLFIPRCAKPERAD